MSYRSSVKSPCPVCGRTKDGDCAIDETADGLKVRCHSYLEDEQVPGFVYRGKTECGTWGLYFSEPVDKPKAVRPASRKEFFYPDNKGFPLAKVVRVDDGKGNKKFSQWYWSREQVWEPALPSEYQKRLHLYRIADDLNRSAIRDGERVLIVEGEGKVDLLLSMGIPATCSIGGAGKWRRYGYPNYLDDLRGAQVVLVPDRDKKGLAHMEDVAKDFPDAEWLFPFSDSPLWNRLPEKGGLDIADWIADFKLSREQVLAEIGKQPSLSKPLVKDSTIDSTSDNEEHEILAAETRSLLQWSSETIEIDNLIPSLALPFRLLGKAFNIPEVIFVAGFLPIGASLLSVGTKIEISAGTGFYPPPVIWTGIIAESGSTKSPIFKILTAPLKTLQAEAEEIYKLNLQAYEVKVRESKEVGDEPVKPKPRNYFFHDFTAEAIALNLEGATNGSLVAVDELEEMLAGFNQYRSKGKGNDRQKWLSIYDSGGIKVDRSSGRRLFLASTPLSILGTIQPEVLKEEMGDLNFVDGLWQRFLWVRLPLTKLPPPQETLACDISELLLGLYRRLEQLPPVTYRISPDARKMWNSWHEWCEDYKLSEPHPSIRALYPKARERAARIALVLHVVESVLQNRMPSAVVEAETIGAAIRFVQWSINQTRILYANLELTDHCQSSVILRFIERFQGQEIDPYRVRYWHSSKAKPSIPECRKFMQNLVNLGYAIGNGKDGKVTWAIGQMGKPCPSLLFPGQKLGKTGQKLGNQKMAKFCPAIQLIQKLSRVARNCPLICPPKPALRE
jgi:hypothetical protein